MLVDNKKRSLIAMCGGVDSSVAAKLMQEKLKHTKYPLGELTKTETRGIAEENGFVNAHKADSQDICFVPNGDYAAVIEHHRGSSCEQGDFVDKNGNVLGKHKSIIRYTIGQRKGLGISLTKPMYVCEIRAKENVVVLGADADLFQSELDVSDVNWISGIAPTESFRCDVVLGGGTIEELLQYVPLILQQLLEIFV